MLAVLVGPSVSARAADPPNAKAPPAMAPSAPSEPGASYPDAVTSHSLAIGGKTIAYTARAGLITLHDTDGKPTAQVFYTADTVDDANPSTRPVTFIYNGGPGSSTMWLRMGSFGPVRVIAADGTPSGPPPYRVIDNQYSLLDKSDLVFIDMPDSGFGRIMPGLEKSFFGVDQDVAAFGQFINNYLSKFNRWNSPKFIFGESYGTPRSAALSEYLVEHGVTLNGVILQSSITATAIRSAAAIGRTCCTCRRKQRPHGITTWFRTGRPIYRRSSRRSNNSRWANISTRFPRATSLAKASATT